MQVRGRIAVSLATVALLAGPPAPGKADQPSKPRVYVETTRVNLVNVDVWVTTPDGAPVYGLQQQEFELSEDGTALEASNFSAPLPPPVTPTESAPATSSGSAGRSTAGDTEPLSLVLLINCDSVSTANRNAVLSRMRSTLAQALASGTARVMLATARPTVRVRLLLTDQAPKVAEVLSVVEGEVANENGYADEQMVGRFLGGVTIDSSTATSPASGGTGTGTGTGTQMPQYVPDPALSEARTLLNQARASRQQTFERGRAALASIARLLDSLADVPGRKVVYYVGNGIPLNPGADTLNAWLAEFGHTQAAATFSAGLDGAQTSLAPLAQQLVGHANTSRATLYCIDTSTEKRAADSFAESRPLLSNTGQGFGTQAGRRAFLQVLSSGTGGRVLANSSDLPADVGRSLAELGACYSLAYANRHPGDGKLHTIEVKVRRSGTRVRHREGYVDKGADDRMVDRSLAALYVGESPNPLAASLSLGSEVKQADGTYVVAVIVRVPLGSLVLLPQGEVHVGAVSAWFAAADDDGRVSQPAKQTFTFKVANERLLTALSQSVSYPVQFLMKPGSKRVVASLRDDNGLTESSVIAEFVVPQGPAVDGGDQK